MAYLKKYLLHFVACLLLGIAVPEARSQAPIDTLDVLFVGNSYVYFNNLPGIVEGIAASLGETVIRSSVHTHGGYTLREHADDAHVAELLTAARDNGQSWDYVLLQEQSTLGARFSQAQSGKLGDPEEFFLATRDLVELLRRYGASAVLYMTWAKEQYPDQIASLSAAYNHIGQELSIPVAPVGIAWNIVNTNRPDISLFTGDGSHPAPAGSYLAACVIYSQLTGRSARGAAREIVGLSWNRNGVLEDGAESMLVSLSSGVAQYLQEVAFETVAKETAPSN
ncbi:MAG: hypothetical protein HKN43_06265 [Rhodothermales bacterium]|nr:hypothetical protein [Rhodothermales bacterium]